MTERVGNVLNVPSQTTKGFTTDDEILAGYAGGITQKGLTILTGQNLDTGTVIKVSATPKKYMGVAKADVGTPAVGVTSSLTVGILRKGVDATTKDMLGNVVLHGQVKGSKVKYTDDVDGLSAAELASLAIALNGRYVAYNDTLIF